MAVQKGNEPFREVCERSRYASAALRSRAVVCAVKGWLPTSNHPSRCFKNWWSNEVVIESKQGQKRGYMIYRGYYPPQVKQHYRSLCRTDTAHRTVTHHGPNATLYWLQGLWKGLELDTSERREQSMLLGCMCTIKHPLQRHGVQDRLQMEQEKGQVCRSWRGL